MIKSFFLASCLLVTSITTQAAIISHNGYERESESNIVKGGGLEWLMWGATNGQTISQALAANAGWRLASSQDMASLFNTFQFGNTVWNSGSAPQVSQQFANSAMSSDAFLELFGITGGALCAIGPANPMCAFESWRYGLASYITDIANGTIGSARVEVWKIHQTSWNIISGLGESPVFGSAVALVRNEVNQPSTVSSPASICIFALGLVAIVARRRHVARLQTLKRLQGQVLPFAI